MKVGYTVAATEGAVTAGDFAIARGEIVLADVSSGSNQRVFDVTWGDVNGIDGIGSDDAMSVLFGSVGVFDTQTFTDRDGGTIRLKVGDDFGDYTLGDVNGVGGIGSDDAMSVLFGSVGVYDKHIVNGESISVNQPITITIPK